MKSRSRNPQLLSLIKLLKSASRENETDVWDRIAGDLSKAKSRRACVNISRINRHTREGQIAAVAGKVLGAGALNHTVTVAAFSFSQRARQKIETAKGRCLTFKELIKKNPKGSNVTIIN